MSMSIVPEQNNTPKNKDVFSDYIPIYNIQDRRLKDKILRTVRKWSDAIENFSQYVVRRLQAQGILCEISSNISPTANGYHISIFIKIRGIHTNTVKKHMSTINRSASERTLSSREYKKHEPGVIVE